MAPRKPAHSTATDTSEAVDAFMKSLEHPHKAAIEALRKAIRGAAPDIREGVKWNAPSFRTTEYFATTNLREKSGIGLILHLGAKIRSLPAGGMVVPDPGKLLKWLAKDRAMIVFKDGKDVAKRKDSLVALVRAWIGYV
jgi:hypothetical protein